MKWISALHISESFESSLQHVAADLKKKLGRSKADFGFISISTPFREEVVDLWSSLKDLLPIKTLIGCTAGGVIGGEVEVEDKAAVSVTAAILPKVKIHAFHLQQADLPDSDGSPRLWRECIGLDDKEHPSFLLLSDPFSLNSNSLIEGLDYAYPESTKIGGLASGGVSPNENLLLLNERLFHQGAVGVAFTGHIERGFGGDF